MLTADSIVQSLEVRFYFHAARIGAFVGHVGHPVSYLEYGGFPNLAVPFWGVPIIRTIVYLAPYWGPPILGNYHIWPAKGIKGGLRGFFGSFHIVPTIFLISSPCP